MILKFSVEYQKIKSTKETDIKYTKIKAEKVESIDEYLNGYRDFLIEDVLGVLFENNISEVILIDSIETREAYRRQGFGSALLKEILEEDAKGIPVVLRAGITENEFKLKCTENEKKRIMELRSISESFWTKNGFVDINALSQFVSSVAMISKEYSDYIFDYLENIDEE